MLSTNYLYNHNDHNKNHPLTRSFLSGIVHGTRGQTSQIRLGGGYSCGAIIIRGIAVHRNHTAVKTTTTTNRTCSRYSTTTKGLFFKTHTETEIDHRTLLCVSVILDSHSVRQVRKHSVRPANFYNDHYDLLLAQYFLFARKISPDATELHARLGALYAAEGVTFTISNEGQAGSDQQRNIEISSSKVNATERSFP